MARPIYSEETQLTSGPIFLKKWDPEGDEYVVFRRPARRESESLATLQAQSVLEWDEASGEQRRTYRQKDAVPLTILESRAVALTLIECSVKMNADDKDPIFVAGKTCRTATDRNPDKVLPKFAGAWAEIPDDLATEIIEKLAEWHRPYDFRGRFEEEGESAGEE